MPLANCKSCGQLFLSQKSSLCTECQEEHDRVYFKVRSYIKSHPHSTVMEIHENTGIPLSKLLEFNRQEYAPFGT